MTSNDREMPKIYVTADDYERLSALMGSRRAGRSDPTRDFLTDELERAELIEAAEIRAKVITMNSRARILDPDTGDERTITLVYPGHEDSAAGKVSIFTLLGSALLGLSEGTRMTWQTRDGRCKSVVVVSIEQSHEARGVESEEAAIEPA